MIKLISSLSLVLLVFSCSPVGELPPFSTGDDDNIDRIDLYGDKHSISADWVYQEPVVIDLSQYSQIDSVIFVCSLRSQLNEEMCIAELYDYTNDTYIGNSTVHSIKSYFTHSVRSDNIKHSVGLTPINVGMRFRSTKQGHAVALGAGSHILIYHQ